MRNFLLLFVFALTTFAVQANTTTPPTDDIGLKIEVVQDQTINVQLENLNQELTRLVITDLTGSKKYISRKVNKQDNYQESLDLSKLADGRYILKVQNRRGVQKQIVAVQGNAILLSRSMK